MSIHFLTVTPQGRLERMGQTSDVNAGLTRLAVRVRSAVDSTQPGRVLYDTHRVSVDALGHHFDQMGAALSLRRDAFNAGLGLFEPPDLTARFSRILEERMPPLTSREAFRANTEAPPGSLFTEQSRVQSTGEAVILKGGVRDVPAVAIGQARDRRPIVYMAAKFEINWLEQLSINAYGAGLNVTDRKLRTTRRVIMELQNRLAWEGSDEHDIWGVLNHPYLDKIISATVFENASDPDDVVKALIDYANYAEEQSGSTFQPNTMVIAPKVFNFIASRRFGSGSDQTILEHFKKACPHITRIVKARELNDAGPASYSGIFFCRSGSGPADSSCELIDVLSPTLLPPQVAGLATCSYMLAGCGGLNQHEVGDNLLVWVSLG